MNKKECRVDESSGDVGVDVSREHPYCRQEYSLDKGLEGYQ